ncbi:Crp/Fnr family transcriptional regulator [Tsuneonella sp. HG094]
MTGMRALRLMALAGGLAIALAAFLGGQNGAVIAVAALFVGVNAWRLAQLEQAMRHGTMRPEERELLEGILRVDDPEKQRRLIGLLTWRDVPGGEVLIRQGQPHPPLIYVASGAGAVELDGQLVAVCGHGDFLGDMSAATGEPASTSVIVTDPMRIALVDRAALVQLGEAVPEIGAAFDRAINRALAAKIRRMNEAAAHG